MQRGGLTGTVTADQSDNLSLIDIERNAINRFDLPVGIGKVFDFQNFIRQRGHLPNTLQ